MARGGRAPWRAARVRRGQVTTYRRVAAAKACQTVLDHPARRRRGRDPVAAHLPARTGRLPRRPGARRRGGAPAVRRGGRRPRGARHHAAARRRARGVPAPAGGEHRPDHHAHRPRRRARQGARARARRRRLHHEAVLDPRVPQPRPRPAASRGDAAPRRAARGGDRSRRRRRSTCPAGRSRCAASPCSSRSSSSSCSRCSPPSPGVVFSRRQLLERIRGSADYREPRTIDVHVRHLREKIERDAARAGADPDGARRRVPVPATPMSLPGGIRTTLAVALLVDRRRRARRRVPDGRAVARAAARRRPARPARARRARRPTGTRPIDQSEPVRARQLRRAPRRSSTARAWSSSRCSGPTPLTLAHARRTRRRGAGPVSERPGRARDRADERLARGPGRAAAAAVRRRWRARSSRRQRAAALGLDRGSARDRRASSSGGCSTRPASRSLIAGDPRHRGRDDPRPSHPAARARREPDRGGRVRRAGRRPRRRRARRARRRVRADARRSSRSSTPRGRSSSRTPRTSSGHRSSPSPAFSS